MLSQGNHLILLINRVAYRISQKYNDFWVNPKNASEGGKSLWGLTAAEVADTGLPGDGLLTLVLSGEVSRVPAHLL